MQKVREKFGKLLHISYNLSIGVYRLSDTSSEGPTLSNADRGEIERKLMRPESLRVYVSEEGKKKIKRKAEEKDRSVSDFLRLKGLGKI